MKKQYEINLDDLMEYLRKFVLIVDGKEVKRIAKALNNNCS